ncbi:hypothetical protein San01_45440 [Streptomyces angustmyceticus]|uniref:Uncharacterized protein n=1 Tax=Streptomyces angustmyceticus TaxID=285578 RepID=A0A5J4LCN6_9ACTN|nr:hypothetical protein San01_45440 [Streptomyces angustmyceticus]
MPRGRRGRTGTRPRRGRICYVELVAPAFAPVLRAGPGTSPPTYARCRLRPGGTVPHRPRVGAKGPSRSRDRDRYGGTAADARWSEGMSGAPPAGPERTPGRLLHVPDAPAPWGHLPAEGWGRGTGRPLRPPTHGA